MWTPRPDSVSDLAGPAILIYFYLCPCVCMLHVWVCLWRSEEDVRCSEAEVTDSCEPADLGTDIRSPGRATIESTLFSTQ